MKSNERSLVLWIGAGALVGGLIPLLLYWLLLAPAPSVSVSAAGSLLNSTNSAAVQGNAGNALADGQSSGPHSIGPFKQWVVILTAFGVKPAYMFVSLAVVFWLWRQRSSDLVALRWGLLVFWLGEAACAVNFMVLQGYSDFWEFLHNYGMAAGFSFIAYALLEGLDRRLIKYSAARDRCSALSLCHACIKYADAPCGLRRMFAMLIPATIIVAFIPLCADLRPSVYDTTVWGKPVHYAEALSDQLFGIRYCPALAILLMTASWLVLLFKRVEPVSPAKILFAAALGPLGFGFMRLFLVAVYRNDAVWANAWEEITELIFVVAIAFVLWIFRQALFAPESSISPNQSNAIEAAT